MRLVAVVNLIVERFGVASLKQFFLRGAGPIPLRKHK